MMLRFRRTNYARGADFERKVRDDLLENYDATLVVRSAGSKGAVDLVAFFDGFEAIIGIGRQIVSNTWVVQVKLDGRLSAHERDLLIDLATATGAKAMIASRGAGGAGIEYREVSA
jgi:Holliday junction resolvase